jgi:excisionase family DNA binding protein
MNTSALLTLDEIAAFLAVSRDTVYRMAQRGKIPAVKVGNQWRFARAEVSAWLKANHNLSQVEPEKRVANGR